MEILIPIPLHLLIFFQDMKERRISIITLFMLLVSVIAILLFLNFSVPSRPSLKDILFNEMMLFVQIAFTVLTIKVLKGHGTKVIDHYLGLGDIVLLAICALCFRSEAFFIFYILSLSAGILIFFVTTILIKRMPRELPFAAVLSFVFIVLSLVSFAGFDRFSPFRF